MRTPWRRKDKEARAIPVAVKALSHPRRLAILDALQDRPMTYAELLRASGTGDSSLFNYHLKKLHPLVERRGTLYHVTALGGRIQSRVLQPSYPAEQRRRRRRRGTMPPRMRPGSDSGGLGLVAACSLSAFAGIYLEYMMGFYFRAEPIAVLVRIVSILACLATVFLLLSDPGLAFLRRVLGAIWGQVSGPTRQAFV